MLHERKRRAVFQVMKPKVFVTREIPAPGLRLLRERCRVEVNPAGRPLTRAELADGLREAEALLCMLTDCIDASVLEQGPRLKVVANMAVGTDNIDIGSCTARGIAVTNTPGALTEATADLAFALLLAVARRVVEGDRYVREGRFRGWAPLLLVGADLSNKILGILGMGRIGRAVARRGRGFGMNILYHNRKPLLQEIERETGAVYASLEDVIRRADFLTLHLPYSPAVHHLLNRERLQMMKPTAYLVNTARGAHVDEEYLVKHLRDKKIAGAALDVYEHEPALAPGLADLENVVLAPHLGSAGRSAREAMALMAASSIGAVLEGKRPEHLVNPEVIPG